MPSILVVEDEPGIRDMLREALEDEGLDNVGAATADCAVRLVENTEFRLIVTDINLPGQLDGISLAQSVRQERPSMAPISFLPSRMTGSALLIMAPRRLRRMGAWEPVWCVRWWPSWGAASSPAPSPGQACTTSCAFPSLRPVTPIILHSLIEL